MSAFAKPGRRRTRPSWVFVGGRYRWARNGALLVLLSFATAGCHRGRHTATEESSPSSGSASAAASAPTIVFLGDSLTAGFGLSEGEALPALIQQRVDAAHLPYHVINAGRSGDTTAGGLARIDWYFKSTLDLRALVIGLGSNDAMRGLPLEAMESNLREIIRRTRERKPQAKIFLWELKTFPNLGQDYATGYAAVFPRVASSEGVALIPFPLEAVAAHPELNQSDGVHPTAEGTQRVAERVWSTLGPAL
jgi:acyl-CoA thioesterase I